MAHAGPGFVHLPNVSQFQLIPVHQLHVSVGFGQGEVGNGLLIEADIPPDLDVFLCLRLLQTLIVVCFEFYQRTEYVLVLVTIFVTQQNLSITTRMISNAQELCI